MESSRASLSDLDALTAASILISASLAGNNSREAQEIAAGFHLTLKERREFSEMLKREERQTARL